MSCSKSPKDLAERVAKFARSRHPSKTAAHVAADTDLGESQVKAWLEGRAAPSGGAMLALIAAYGPEFLALVMPRALGWLDTARQEREIAETQARIQADLARLRMLKAPPS